VYQNIQNKEKEKESDKKIKKGPCRSKRKHSAGK
jgi:hypothetical protein